MRRIADKGPGPDYFGFLPKKWSFEFEGGKIRPYEDFDKVLAWVEKRLHEDGHLYPPLTYQERLALGRDGKLHRAGKRAKIPKTERPAHLWPVPPSHVLLLDRQLSMHTRRDGDSAFILHSLGYLFETRLQFYEWRFDGRIRIKQSMDPLFTQRQVEHFLSEAYRTWRGWSPDQQKRFVNVLYMYCRAPSYEFFWEQYIFEYMVCDGCWKMAQELFHWGKTLHAERLFKLCENFSIPYEKKTLESMVRLRNDLFHEALWSKTTPPGCTDDEGAVALFTLRPMNHEFIARLLGF